MNSDLQMGGGLAVRAGGAEWKEGLRARARELGFVEARVTSAVLPEGPGAVYRDWVAAGRHGEMGYMERLVEERASGVEHVLPGARSVIVLAASYWSDEEPRRDTDGHGQTRTGVEGGVGTDPGISTKYEMTGTEAAKAAEGRVRVARYALGRDYHYVLRERLVPLIEWLEGEFPGESFRPCVDSAPLLERAYAAASGIGFIGKNTMVITWMQGSFTFLCEVLTTAEIEPDEPREGTCGNCTRCLDACPTQAFPRAGVLDARKCISYLTIEKKSELTEAEIAATGEWIFGCDVCQDVCPYNKAPEVSKVLEFQPGTVVNAQEPVETFLSPESNRQFERKFAGSPILRAGKRRITRRANKAIECKKAKTR